MKKWMGLISLCLICSGARAGMVFLDTFNAADTTDMNSNYAARQAGGAVTGSCTGNQDWYGIAGNALVHSGGGEIVLDTNLASIVGNNFEVSIKQTMLNTNAN